MNNLFLDCIKLLGKIREHRESYSTIRKIKEHLGGKSFCELNVYDVKLYTLMQTFIDNSIDINWDFSGYTKSYDSKNWSFYHGFGDEDQHNSFPKYKDEDLLDDMMFKLLSGMTKLNIGDDYIGDDYIGNAAYGGSNSKLNCYGFDYCRTDFKKQITFSAMGYKYNKDKKIGKTRGSLDYTLNLIDGELKLA